MDEREKERGRGIEIILLGKISSDMIRGKAEWKFYRKISHIMLPDI